MGVPKIEVQPIGIMVGVLSHTGSRKARIRVRRSPKIGCPIPKSRPTIAGTGKRQTVRIGAMSHKAWISCNLRSRKMDKLIAIGLTVEQWNVLEVALDRFIEDQAGDDSEEAREYYGRAVVAKVLMQNVLRT
tara:strand:+ start:470 stop:865 length:396 start_codon:yes stop_codon:yes gene_type:complete